MSVRAVIYARYSTNLQNPASIADQVASCRELAARLGADVVQVFSDAAIGGKAVGNRPGYQDMMAAAARGEFDLVLAEALDRVSRGQADTAVTYEDLDGLGVRIHTISEGLVDELHVGLKGTMNALALRDTATKTRRGLKGVLDSGRSIVAPYGYDVVRKIGDDGEIVVGLRKINEAEKAVVLRIFEDYVAGLSPRKIAYNLNAEGIPSSRARNWGITSINGSGVGILRNEIYRGVIVWGKRTSRKDRRSGKRKLTLAPADKIVRVVREDLRIVSEDLWARAAARLAAHSAPTAGRAQAQRRPKRLLSGIVVCGTCGRLMTSAKGEVRDGVFHARLQCGGREQRGPATCSNARTPYTIDVERRVLAAVRERLLRPEAVEAAVREVHRLMAERAKTAGSDRGRLDRELADTRRQAERLVDLVADGAVAGATVREKLKALETRAETIERELAGLVDNTNVVAIHPAAGDHYRRLVQDLADQLDNVGAGSEASEATAREAFRELIGQVRLIPGEKRGEYELEIVGELQRVLAFITGRSLGGTSADQLGEYRISG
jgi:DNA invertase Pin-like site-specific DNA recombinase